MVPALFFYQLGLVALVWLCLMLLAFPISEFRLCSCGFLVHPL
jgi:hypothetical protein